MHNLQHASAGGHELHPCAVKSSMTTGAAPSATAGSDPPVASASAITILGRPFMNASYAFVVARLGMRFVTRLAALLAVSTAGPAAVAAQPVSQSLPGRLPAAVIPVHYEISVAPDALALSFTG